MSVCAILGAPDPEMAAIERLLTAAGVPVAYACTADGVRVHPGTAYQAAGTTEPAPVTAATTVLAVECGGDLRTSLLRHAAQWVDVDHHRPGDVGYGVPASDYLRGSSIGQVVGHLARAGLLPVAGWRRIWWPTGAQPGHEVGHVLYARGVLVRVPDRDDGDGARPIPQWATVPQWVLDAAAADHCLHAAYRGGCPRVDPDALMRWRAQTRAQHQGRPVASVLADVQRARDWLRAQPGIPHAADPIPELPEAAAREGRAFTADVRERDGRMKTVLQGADARTIRAWLAEQSAAGRQTYGDPERGFAGAYHQEIMT